MVEGGEQCDDGANNGASGDPCDTSCQMRLMVDQSASAGGTVTTDTGSTGATPAFPVQAALTTPNAGEVSIVVTSNMGTPPSGIEFIGKEVDITAPGAVPATPLTLVFEIDDSRIRTGENQQTIDVLRDGTTVPACIGDPGEAFPDPCVSDREVLGGGNVQITILTKAASVWTFGVQLCGNYVLDAGEQCDPPGPQAQCAAGQVCGSLCQCGSPCDCCAASPSTLSFTTQVGSGNCGTTQSSTGTTLRNLACGSLYFGGGSNTVPAVTMPDQGQSVMKVAACDSGSGRLTLAATTSTDTGSPRTCTTTGCLFGAPVPAPNPTSTPTSVCLVNTIAQDVTGSATCGGEVTALNLPVHTEIFLSGDLFPNAPGIQTCPVCNRTCNFGTNTGGPCNLPADCPGGGACVGPNQCHGGPNDGSTCTPSDSALSASLPTSHDCPPSPALTIGGIPDGFTLTTGTVVGTAVNQPLQQRVFCGFCRDVSNLTSLCFDGDPDGSCPDPNSTCAGAGTPDACCTGAGSGTCVRTLISCTADAQCPAAYPDCQQRNSGAFGPAGGSAKTITETGVPGACLANDAQQALTLAGGFCYPPTFNSTIDGAADLPGPGAISLPGVMQLQ